MPLSNGQILNNRYRINAQLSQSRYGGVYRAWDLNLNIQVALKENFTATPKAAQQFAVEARLLANLRHPNLPFSVDQFALPDQTQYLVLEFVEGQSLQNLLAQASNGLPERDVAAWFAAVCDALTYLHAQSPPLMHRNINPANIIIRPSGAAVLVGFGIARQYLQQGANTVSGDAFAAPELYAGQVNAASDVYSLGATLYAVLTSRQPVSAMQRQQGMALATPRQLNPGIRPETERAILRAMELNPANRFQSVQDFQAALRLPAPQAYHGAVGTAVPVPATVEAQPYDEMEQTAAQASAVKDNHRNKNLLIVGLAVVVCLCLSAVAAAGIGGYYMFIVSPSTASTQAYQDVSLTNTALAILLAQTPTPTLPQLTATWTQTPEPSQTPTFTSVPPTLTSVSGGSPSPTSILQPTWQPCPGIYPSRLHVGDKAYVTLNPPLPNRVRTRPNPNSTILGFVQPGEAIEITGGPVCSDQWVWWQVRSLETNMAGWTAEGDGNDYWLVPAP